MLKQILGIPISLKASRIFKKIISSALLICVLGSVVFATGLQTFADSNLSSATGDIKLISYTNGGIKENDGVLEYELTYKVQTSINNYIYNNRYFGFYILSLPLIVTLNDAHASTGQVIEVGVSNSVYKVDYRMHRLDFAYQDPNYSYWNQSRLNFGIDLIFTLVDDVVTSGYTFDVSIKLKFAYRVNNPNTPDWSFNRGSSSSFVSLSTVKKENLLMEDILFAQEATNNLLSTTLNNLNIDYSDVSNNVNSAASSAATAELVADTAISSALPSADAQLDSIAAYDYNSIHADNATAFSFWKSLGDYILSNSNLRGIGALLILCLFLGFVVFLLRL